MIVNGTTYSDETPAEVIKILESARRGGRRRRLRLFYGDPETGRDWCEEYETMGYVSRSTGLPGHKIPILVHNTRSMGGGAISTDSIVKIMDTRTKRVLWQHPTYHLPEHKIGHCSVYNLPFRVYIFDQHGDQEDRGYFGTMAQAQRFIAFLKGERMRE